MSKPINLGIIGAGHMTRKNHLPALVRLQDEGLLEIKEICDINLDSAKEAAQRYSIPLATHDSQALIEREEIDAVCIFGPADVHYQLGLEVLRAGKHLFVEKPPAQNIEQLLEMIEAAKAHGRIAVAGFNRRFQGPIVEVATRVAPGSIQSAEAMFNKPQEGMQVPFGMKTLLGVNSIHALDTLLFVMGDRPTALYAAKNGGNTDAPESFSALIEWERGRHATLSANNSAGSRTEQYTFHTPGVSYVCEGEALTVTRDNGETERLESTDKSKGLYEEFKAFVSAIDTGEAPVNALKDALPTLYLVELVEQGHRGAIDWSVIDEKTKAEVRQAQVVKTPERRIPKGRSVLVLNPKTLSQALPALSKTFELVYPEDLKNLSQEKRAQVSVAITGGKGAPLEAWHLDLLPSLAILGVVGASVKRWGGALALERGVAVVNTADSFAGAVAEFIVMQALVGLRRASVAHETIRKGRWGIIADNKVQHLLRRARRKFFGVPFPQQVPSQTLAGRVVGVVGWGEITKKSIPLFIALGAKVLVHSEHAPKEELEALGARQATLEEILRADVVSLQRGLSPRTKHFFGVREINALKPGAVFINSARAGLVDTEALVARLKKGDLFACLDVFDEEPLSAHNPLRNLQNVFLTPHIAGAIYRTEGLLEVSTKKLIEKISNYLDGKPVETITKEQFENMT